MCLSRQHPSTASWVLIWTWPTWYGTGKRGNVFSFYLTTIKRALFPPSGPCLAAVSVCLWCDSPASAFLHVISCLFRAQVSLHWTTGWPGPGRVPHKEALFESGTQAPLGGGPASLWIRCTFSATTARSTPFFFFKKRVSSQMCLSWQIH